MVCFNPDGSLATTARMVLSSLIQPGALEDIMRCTSLPAHQLHPYLGELLNAGLVVEKQGSFQITDIGIALLNT